MCIFQNLSALVVRVGVCQWVYASGWVYATENHMTVQKLPKNFYSWFFLFLFFKYENLVVYTAIQCQE